MKKKNCAAARMTGHPGPQPFPMATPGMMPPMVNPGMHAQPLVSNAPFDAMNFNAKPDKKLEESDEAKLEKKKKEEAAKKKKEEEEKAKQAPAKPQDKSRPISSTPIAGTPWCVVWTGDGRVFFYNPSTRTSVWERPEDLVGRADVDKAVASTPAGKQIESSQAIIAMLAFKNKNVQFSLGLSLKENINVGL